MAEAIAAGIANKRHIAVQAGTGTGKTLAYLVPAVLARKKTIVATATKALQDQLALKDLPFLERHLERPFSWAILKGRPNYLCMQRLSELASRAAGGAQLGRDGDAARAPAAERHALANWTGSPYTGDRAQHDVEPCAAALSAESTIAVV